MKRHVKILLLMFYFILQFDTVSIYRTIGFIDRCIEASPFPSIKNHIHLKGFKSQAAYFV